MKEIRLISTKLIAPVPRKHYLRRDALFSKLRQLAEHKLAVIQGPAGSGKTTLMTSFMKEFPEGDYRWISLDKSNNDLFSFWYYFLEALKGDLGDKAQEFLAIFEAFLQKQNIENILILLVNQLQHVPSLTIVWDDFHVLEDEQLLQSIQFFMKYSPDQLRFVLVTREAPQLYLGDLMMSDQYLEINEQDLKFSTGEALYFLQRTLAAKVDEDTAGQLNELTEGWVGGLQLIALAMSQKQDISLEQVKGLNKYLVSYLSNEILRSLEAEEMQFLLCTSILDYFDVSICNELLGIQEAKKIIHRLAEKNMFLVTIDEEEGLYRYHHLFGEFLRIRLEEEQAQQKDELHVKAAILYKQRGDLEESIKHYFHVGRYREARELIIQMRHPVTSWVYLQQIPLEQLSDDMDLVFQRVFYHFCNLEFEQCNAVLELLQQRITEDTYWNLLRFIRFSMDNTAVDLEMDLRSIDEIEDMGLTDVTKSIIYVTSSMLLGLQDQYAKALACIEKAIKLDRHVPNPYIRYFALACQSQLLESVGELQQCERIYESLFQLIEEHSYLAPLSVNTLIGIAGVYMKRMQLDQAEEYFAEAGRQLQKGHPSMERGYSHNLLEMYVLLGDRQQAVTQIQQLAEHDIYYEHPLYHSSMLKYQLVINEVDAELLRSFVHWIEHDQKERLLRYDDQLVYARVLVFQGELNRANAYLDQILKEVRKHKIKLILIEALLLKIRILRHTKGDSDREILNLIREAVHYSYANEIAYPYVLEGEVAFEALSGLIKEREKDLLTKEKRFVARLCSLQAGEDKKGERQTEEVLSEREQQVLQILSTGLSNKEIGNRLYISVATVKTHLINIYSKLNVSTRLEAVEKARQLGLLQD